MSKIAIVSDTHLGSIYSQLTALKKFYKIAEESGCEFVLNAGDLVDGQSMRRGHEFECCVQGADALVQYVVDHYPSNLKTFLIGGNHDESLRSLAGFDIIQAISKERSDFHYMGMHQAIFSLSGVKIAIFHGAGAGCPSNRLVKTYAEACKSGAPPDLLVNGHLHSWDCKPFHGENDACLIQAPCFQGQTPYNMRKLQTPDIGAVIWERPEKGVSIPVFRRFKERKNDY